MLEIVSSFIASSDTSPGWVESFEKGSLFALVSMNQSHEKRNLFSRTIFNTLSREYYESNLGNTKEAFRLAFEKASEILGEGQLFAAVVHETKLFCIGSGGSFVCLYRGGVSVTLLKSEIQKTVSVSGFIKSGDFLVCGTRQFEQVLADVSSLSISSRNPSSLSELLFPAIQRYKDGQIGAWFLKVQDPFKGEEADVKGEEDKKVSPFTKLSLPHTLDKRPVYIREESPLSVSRKKKTPLVLGLVLVLFLIGSIIIGNKKQEERKKEALFQTQITSLNEKLSEAITLTHINPERSRELFSEVQETINEIETTELQRAEIQEVQGKIAEFQEEILGEKKANLSLFVDLSLLSDGFSSEQTTDDVSNVYVFDSEAKRIAKIGLSSKHAEIVVGPSALSDINAISSYVDTLYGISVNGISRLTPFQNIISDKLDNALIFAYAGNMYVLDKNDSQIYKYNGGAQPKLPWLTNGITPDLTDARSWIIDGTIWVLKENGEILHFANGNQFAFSLYGVVPVIENPDSFYTNELSENIYVLDATHSRIAVFEKSGAFVTQYVSGELINAKFILVREEDKTVFVVMKDKVYSFKAE